MYRSPGFLIVLWVAVLVLLGIFAFGTHHGRWDWDDGPGYGWRGMGGWGGRYPGADGSGWNGMGPGMMAGAGYGWTVPGMPGYGWGYGMGRGTVSGLTTEQERKLAALQAEAGTRYQVLMQQRWELRARLDQQYAAEPPDWAAIRQAALALADAQRQQAEAEVDLQQKMAAVLTDGQRRELLRLQQAGGWRGTP